MNGRDKALKRRSKGEEEANERGEEEETQAQRRKGEAKTKGGEDAHNNTRRRMSTHM